MNSQPHRSLLLCNEVNLVTSPVGYSLYMDVNLTVNFSMVSLGRLASAVASHSRFPAGKTWAVLR